MKCYTKVESITAEYGVSKAIISKWCSELRKEIAFLKKADIQDQIRSIYHSHNGVDGYRSMAAYLKRAGYSYSATTIHKYMDTQMGLRSIVRLKKPENFYIMESCLCAKDKQIPAILFYF